LLDMLNELAETEWFTVVHMTGTSATLDFSVPLTMLVEPDIDNDPDILDMPGSKNDNPLFA